MKKRATTSTLCRIAAYCAVFIVMLGSARAATVRGQLNRPNGKGIVPAAGVCITVSTPKGARFPRACSDFNGMYYLPNVPPGDYLLEIWTSPDPKAPPKQQNIRVVEPYTDIQPITVP
jgi:hypothetical protein